MYIKTNRFTESLVNYIRENDPICIPKLKEYWKNADIEKAGEIEIT